MVAKHVDKITPTNPEPNRLNRRVAVPTSIHSCHIIATAEQIKSLIRSHLEENGELFYTVALQLAAHEIKGLVDKSPITSRWAMIPKKFASRALRH